MRKIIGAIVGFIAVFGSLAVATPAHAVASCPSGWICFYDTAALSAPRIESRDAVDGSVGECFVMPSAANNRTSYIYNNSNRTWRTYNAGNCTGVYGTISPNSIGGMSSAHNNNISSYRWN